MKISRELNIVFELERETGPIFVHSTPVSRAIFELYFIPISKTFAAIYGEGLSHLAGPRIAGMMMKKISQDGGIWDGAHGVENGLFGEIIRLTNVILPDPAGGWRTTPLYIALKDGLLTAEEKTEVEGILAFFTVISLMHLRSNVPAALYGMRYWDVQTTSLNSTEFATSLPISTTDDNSGKVEATASSVPS